MAQDNPQRIVIFGSSGGGKSTLARRLGEASGLPVYHLDRLFWNPGWVQTPPDEFDARVREVIATDRWIIDGNHTRALQACFERADLIIYIAISRYRAIWRVVKREVTQYGQTRPDMSDGCPERIDLDFLRWIWNYPKQRGARDPQLIADARAAGKRVVMLKAGREAEEFVRTAVRSVVVHSAPS